MRPLIGVMPLWDEQKQSIWMLPHYLEGIEAASGIPFIFPLTDDDEELEALVKNCDGLLFTGGQDVSPELYGQKALDGLVECCSKRDLMEKKILDIALSKEKSILGICRGIQFINVALGGTLYQDLPSMHKSGVNHAQKAPYDKATHKVELTADTPLLQLSDSPLIGVNSLHHQAVKEKSPSLEIMGISEDGIIEALFLPDYRFLWAVQWHPEYSYESSTLSRKIFSSFVKSAGRQ